MGVGVQFISATPGELFTADVIRDRCRANSSQDALIADLVEEAIAKVERDTSRSLFSTTWEQLDDSFPSQCNYASIEAPANSPTLINIRLRRPGDQRLILFRAPVVSVVSLQYFGTDGAWHTVSSGDYRVVNGQEPSYLVPAVNKWWPTDVAAQPGSVKTQFTTGYASADLVPKPLRGAVAKLVAHWLQHPEAAGMQLFENPIGYDDDVEDWKYVWGF
jgi:hypothetical protein